MSPAPAGSVSVVIPTHNGRAFLGETLASVLAQTHQPLEIVVVDDGSTDGTAELLTSMTERGGVIVLRQAQGGTASARNTGLAAARGEFVAFLDHDDLWPADTVERHVAVMTAVPDVAVSYGYMESFGLERPYRWPGPDGPTGDVSAAFRRKNWIRSPGQALLRAEAVRAAGGFDPAVAGADDWDLYLSLAARWRFHYEHRLALRYRAHGANQSKRAWRMFRHACAVQARHAGRWPSGSLAARARWVQCRATLVHMLARDLAARRGLWTA
ncbi:MAG: glycosyltransferase family 2 protein [Vicinamibacterales bacterium]